MQSPGFVNDRVVVIEDAREIAITSPDCVQMLSSDNTPLHRLVKHTLRYRPGRIIVGEIADGDTAIQMIQALNTGHQGSCSSIHANSAEDALARLEDLTSIRFVVPPKRAISTAVGCIIFVNRGCNGARNIEDVIYVNGLSETGEYVCA